MNKTHTATPGRLDVFLAEQEPGHSRSYLQKLVKEGRVAVNGNPATKTSHALEEGDVVTIDFPEKPDRVAAQDLPLDILFEDEHLIVINKPAGMQVHPNSEEEGGTVVNALLHYDPAIRAVVHDEDSAVSRLRPGIVHRLDKETSGLLVIAKRKEALAKLGDLFREHTVHKEYLAIVHGSIINEITVKTGFGRKVHRPDMMGVKPLGEGREAVSVFTPIDYDNRTAQVASLVRCIIQTGRTHQIRVHAKHLGRPVLGDPTYTHKAAAKLSERLGLKRQMLHAWRLAFVHPFTGEKLAFQAGLPEDMITALTKLKLLDSLKQATNLPYAQNTLD